MIGQSEKVFKSCHHLSPYASVCQHKKTITATDDECLDTYSVEITHLQHKQNKTKIDDSASS